MHIRLHREDSSDTSRLLREYFLCKAVVLATPGVPTNAGDEAARRIVPLYRVLFLLVTNIVRPFTFLLRLAAGNYSLSSSLSPSLADWPRPEKR